MPRTRSRNANDSAQYTTWSILAGPSRSSLAPAAQLGQARPGQPLTWRPLIPIPRPFSYRIVPPRYQTCQSSRPQARAACRHDRGDGDDGCILHAVPEEGARGISIAGQGIRARRDTSAAAGEACRKSSMRRVRGKAQLLARGRPGRRWARLLDRNLVTR